MKRSTYSDEIIGEGGEISLNGAAEHLSLWIGGSRVKLKETGIMDLIDSLQKFLACRAE